MKRTRYFIITIICTVCLLAGCTDERQCVKTLDLAYDLLNEGYPDSAFNLLEGMQDDVSGLSSNRQMRFYYLLGLAYNDKDEVPMAMHSFHEACDCADTTRSDCDLHTLSRAHGQLAQIFLEQDAPQNALKQLLIAYRIAKKDLYTLMAIATFSKCTEAYKILNKMDSAVLVKQKASRYYLEYGDTLRSALSLEPIIDVLLDKGNFSLAKEYMDIYEKYSGRFDENGSILDGFEIYYYDKSLYYLNQNKLDSAEYFARQVIKSKRFSDLEAGYKALYLLYNKTEQKDSLAKYAMLAYETNDSVYRELSTDNYQRMQAVYDYTRHQQLAERSQQESNYFRLCLVIAVSVSIIIILFILFFYYQTRKKKEQIEDDFAHLQQERTALEELMAKKQQEFDVEIDEKQAAIKAIEMKLSETQTYKELNAIDMALQSDAITKKFRDKACGKGAEPTYNDWLLLRALVDHTLPGFVPSIKKDYPQISSSDIELCLLVRLRFRTDEIATLSHLSSSGVSKAKGRLLTKIFKTDIGGAKEFERRLLKIH